MDKEPSIRSNEYSMMVFVSFGVEVRENSIAVAYCLFVCMYAHVIVVITLYEMYVHSVCCCVLLWYVWRNK